MRSVFATLFLATLLVSARARAISEADKSAIDAYLAEKKAGDGSLLKWLVATSTGAKGEAEIMKSEGHRVIETTTPLRTELKEIDTENAKILADTIDKYEKEWPYNEPGFHDLMKERLHAICCQVYRTPSYAGPVLAEMNARKSLTTKILEPARKHKKKKRGGKPKA